MHVSIQNRQKRFTKNINKVLDSALPSDFVEGAAWYREARLWAYGVSKRHGVSLRKVCAMLAALSPRSKWERNKIDCESIIIALSTNTALPKCSTYGAMVRKAINIFNAKTDSVDGMTLLLNGPKITAFFLNIYDCNSQRVTVDTWIHLVSLGEYLSVEDRPALTKKDYQLIESIISETAKAKNVPAPVLQAVLWVAFKRTTESKEFN
jgi:hypothetical protein